MSLKGASKFVLSLLFSIVFILNLVLIPDTVKAGNKEIQPADSQKVEAKGYLSGYGYKNNVEILPEVLYLTVGQIYELYSELEFYSANQNIIWRSSNPNVATVSPTGVVTAIGDGYVEIDAISAVNPFESDECAFYIGRSGGGFIVDDVEVNPEKLVLGVGKTQQLSATVEPAGASSTVTWSSNNPGVATVTASGLVRGVRAGTALIIATSTQNPFESDECKVTVTGSGGSATILVDDVDVYPEKMTLGVGKTRTIQAVVEPVNASNRKVNWSSNNTKVATVSSTGLVRGISPGIAYIKATSAGNSRESDTCKVTVTRSGSGGTTVIPVSDLDVVPERLSLRTGKTYTLRTIIKPSNASNKSLTWTSSNSRVASVSSTGVVRGLKAGTATITVRSKSNPSEKDTCKVTVSSSGSSVTVSVTDVDIYPERLTLSAGSTKKLTTVVEPSNASNRNLNWSSSNTSVATVSASGIVRALRAGTAVITVSSQSNPEERDSCRITVIY